MWLPVHPQPKGPFSHRAESLSGYCQRLSYENRMPLLPLIKMMAVGQTVCLDRKHRRCFDPPDLNPSTVPFLANVTLLAADMVQSLTLYPLYASFYGSRPFSPLFFSSPYQKPIFSWCRRYCPLCLREEPYFRLLWQLAEVQVCPLHRIVLRDRCAECGKCLPLWSGKGVQGRCASCHSRLANHSFRKPSAAQLTSQESIIQDYCDLLDHKYTFVLGGDTDPSKGWRLRFRYLRLERRLAHKTVAMLAGVSPSTALAVEREGQMLSFATLLTMIRFYCGSLAEFHGIGVPTTPEPEEEEPRDRILCINPWCSSYRTEQFMHLRRTYGLCQTCGVRSPRGRRAALFGLLLPRFFLALSRFYAALQKGVHWQLAYRSSGLKPAHRRKILHRLSTAGVISRNGPLWLAKIPRRKKVFGFPFSPAFAYQVLASRHVQRYTAFVIALTRALKRHARPLRQDDSNLSIARCAALLDVSASTVSYRLKTIGLAKKEDSSPWQG